MLTNQKPKRDKVWAVHAINYEGKQQIFLVKHNIKAMKSAHPYASVYMYNLQEAKALAKEQCILFGTVKYVLKVAEIEYIPFTHLIRVLIVEDIKQKS